MECKNFKVCGNEVRGNAKLCGSCYSKEYRKNNPEKVKAYNEMRYIRDIEKIQAYQKTYRDKSRFGVSRNIILERDNWQCQKCGMTQEAHFVIFNRSLDMHHIDGEGRGKQNPNNDIDNIISLCTRCHTKFHNDIMAKERWGNLIVQDDSVWEFPKLREMVQSHIDKGLNVGEAKRKVAKKLNKSYGSIDHKYYVKKHNALSTEQEVRK